MRSGICFRRPRRARRIFGSGSTYWPTPVANLSSGFNRSASPNAAVRHSLVGLAKTWNWPTPTAADGMRTSDRMMRGNPTLTGAAMRWLWPTPTAMDSHASGGSTSYSPKGKSHSGTTLTDATVRSSLPIEAHLGLNGSPGSPRCRALNPSFVETLMGWPPGATDCASSVTGLCRWLRRWRSCLCELV